MHQSPRSIRQGVRHLMAGLSVADGQVYGLCTTRKRFVDFRSFVEEVLLPEALRRQVKTLILILDNGTTHAPKQLTHCLEEQAEAYSCHLSIQVACLPTDASWLEERRNGECRDYDDNTVVLVDRPLEQVLEGKDKAKVDER
jgi:hypothetical protein